MLSKGPRPMRQESPIAMQGRVLFALVMREMTTRYGRNVGGYVWAVLEPVATIALLSLIFSFIARQPPLGTHFPIFFATGYLPFHFYLDISRAVSASVTSNRALLTFPRVTIIDTVLARLILQSLTSFFVATIIITAFLLYFDEAIVIKYKFILFSTFLSIFIGFSVGIFNCITFTLSSTWQSIFGILNRPMFILSGVFYLFESIPNYAQYFLWWNPLIHITALMRAGFYPIYEPSFVSPAYVIMFAAVPFIIGILLIRAMQGALLET
jgi:capsular polysaccharide transport system permease protein